MKWKLRHSLATALALAASGFYLYFLHRTIDVKDVGDWHVAFSYQPFHCRVCLGRVEELTYRGAPINIPNWRWQCSFETPRVHIQTPVGLYCAFQHSRYWGAEHAFFQLTDVSESVTQEEVAIGWYDATGGKLRETSDAPFIRKAGTPAHWCMMATNDAARWIEPENLGKVAW